MLEIERMGLGGRVMWDNFLEETQGDKEVKCKSDQFLQICIDILEEHGRDATYQISITIFPEVIDDLSAIVHVIGIEYGHTIVLGVKSRGSKSLSRLALCAVNPESFQVLISSAYDQIEWGEDLKQFSKQCGVQDQPTALVIYDGQIPFALQIEGIANLVTRGDIPLLFSSEEIQVIKPEVRRSELELSDNYSTLFIQSLSCNLDIVLVVSPSGTVYRDVCIRFPAIRPDCPIDRFMLWSARALESVKREKLFGTGARYVLPVLLRPCVAMDRSFEDRAKKILAHARGIVTITPSRYFQRYSVLQRQTEQCSQANAAQIARYETGAEQIQATRPHIAQMSEQIDSDIPVIETTRREDEGMLAKLAMHRGEVETTAAAVEERSRTAETEAATAAAANAVAIAQNAVQCLDKDSFGNVKKLQAPSTGMKDTFDVICRMFGRAPPRVEGAVFNAKEDDF
jgi:hypothetical protein